MWCRAGNQMQKSRSVLSAIANSARLNKRKLTDPQRFGGLALSTRVLNSAGGSVSSDEGSGEENPFRNARDASRPPPARQSLSSNAAAQPSRTGPFGSRSSNPSAWQRTESQPVTSKDLFALRAAPEIRADSKELHMAADDAKFANLITGKRPCSIKPGSMEVVLSL